MKYLLLTLSLFFGGLLSQAQEPELPKNIYSFVPQYLIKRGIRIDIDHPIKGRHYLQFCPQFYLSEQDAGSFANQDNEYTFLVGGGMNLYHKIFASENHNNYGFYMSYGLAYNFFSLDYFDYSGEISKSAHGTIHKMGGDLILGYNTIIREVFSLDFYAGLGTRYSLMDAGGADTDRFNDSWLGYNYSGNLMHLGIRLGIQL